VSSGYVAEMLANVTFSIVKLWCRQDFCAYGCINSIGSDGFCVGFLRPLDSCLLIVGIVVYSGPAMEW
jgi:hypothetical protein